MENNKALTPEQIETRLIGLRRQWATRDDGKGLVAEVRILRFTRTELGEVIKIEARRNGRVTNDDYMVVATHGRNMISMRDAEDEFSDREMAGENFPVTIRRLAKIEVPA